MSDEQASGGGQDAGNGTGTLRAVGRWFPEMPPALPGETDAQYTDRLTGADGTMRRPFDHRRYRQCSIGYHDECSMRYQPRPAPGYDCECPCHTPDPQNGSDGLLSDEEFADALNGVVAWLADSEAAIRGHIDALTAQVRSLQWGKLDYDGENERLRRERGEATQERDRLRERERFYQKATASAAAEIDELTAQRDRARNIAVALEQELADKAVAAERLAYPVRYAAGVIDPELAAKYAAGCMREAIQNPEETP